MPLAAELFYGLDELDILRVRPTTFAEGWIERVNPTLPAGLVGPSWQALSDGIPAASLPGGGDSFDENGILFLGPFGVFV